MGQALPAEVEQLDDAFMRRIRYVVDFSAK
jgi:hypothetical protein